MRLFLRKVWGSLLTGLVFACMAFLFLLYRAPVFAEGEGYTFYFGESSSADALTSSSPALAKLLLPVKGESVRYEGDCYAALKAHFRARVCFVEEAGGSVSYYLRSPLLGRGLLLNGQTVNLQIAVGNGQTAAGTPVIFGGW